MPKLTPQLIENFPFSRYADPGSIQRGLAYYKDGNAWSVELITKREAIILVDGNSGEYTVEIEVDKETGELSFDCDCPYAEAHFCKHVIAAALELSEYLKAEDDIDYDEDNLTSVLPAFSGNWQNTLKETLALAPRRSSTSPNLSRYVLAILLTRSQMGYYGYGSNARPSYSYSIEPLIIKANKWYELAGGEKKTPQEINAFLETNKKWIKASERMFQHTNPLGCLNLDTDAASLVNILSDSMRYGIGTSNLPMLLSMLAKFSIPMFLGSHYPEKIERRIHLLPNPIEIKIDLQNDENKLTLQAGYEHEGTFKHIQRKVEPISNNPAWVLLDDTIAQLRNVQALSMLPSFPIEIPNGQVELFREQYFAQIAQLLPIKSDIVHWQDVNAEPTARLYLHDDNKDKTLRADLRFGYGEH